MRCIQEIAWYTIAVLIVFSDGLDSPSLLAGLRLVPAPPCPWPA